MGIDVEDYRYDEKEEQLYTVRTISGKKYELPFNHESDGTRKLIAALPVILVALQEGRLVIIDELDAKLHPKLLRYVISMFKNKKINKYGAQLLFTSHDIATMKTQYSEEMKYGLQLWMKTIAAKFIPCMKLDGKTMKE